MRVIEGDLWRFHADGAWVGITTNGTNRRGEEAIMGKGVALQAANRFPALPKVLGGLLAAGDGNHVHAFEEWRLLTFPVKGHWRNGASHALIERSARELGRLLDLDPWMVPVYLPKPGCGAGGLTWQEVEPLLKCLGDRVTIVNYKEVPSVSPQSPRQSEFQETRLPDRREGESPRR